MAKKIGLGTYRLDNPVYMIGSGSIAGAKEADGPFGKYFTRIVEDDGMGEDSYEKAERRMLEETVFMAIKDAGLTEEQIDLFVGGDLLNQIVSANYTARAFNIPFLGVYGACSTMAESLIVGSMFLDGGFGDCVACATCSHFSSSERQFRNPLELGAQRQTYSQWTVTGTGCSVLATYGKGPRITHFTIGNVTDYGVMDIANMGAAMAPAAMKTLVRFFKDTNSSPSDYDLIITGDLGKLGSDILRDLMAGKGYPLGQTYADCGHSIYSNTQKTFQGGSGAGCSASVLNSYIIEKLRKNELKKVVFMPTGALMSTTTNQQGDTIPAVAHLVVIEA